MKPRTSLDALGNAFRRFFRRAPRQSRSRAAVDAVVQALDERLMRGESIDEITIEALSERAGVASGSFYEYFVDKDSALGVLVGRLTHRNFVELASQLERIPHTTLDRHVHEFAQIIVETYFGHPLRLRALVLGIGKLALWDVVTAERDRFAEVLARTAKAYLPDADDAELRRTFCLVADATIGILAAESVRPQHAPLPRLVEEISTLSRAIVRARHTENAPRY